MTIQEQFDARVAAMCKHRTSLVIAYTTRQLSRAERDDIRREIQDINHTVKAIASEYRVVALQTTVQSCDVVRSNRARRQTEPAEKQRIDPTRGASRKNRFRSKDNDAPARTISLPDCSLRSAPTPWMWSWGVAFKPFSEMKIVPNHHEKWEFDGPPSWRILQSEGRL